MNIDKNTLASSDLESIDRVVAFKCFCVCYHENTDHHSVKIDSPNNTASIQMMETWGCKKCGCGKYREYKREKIDHSLKLNQNDNEIFGIEQEPFYVFCFTCNDMFKVNGLFSCPKLVVGCENEKVCPHCDNHLKRPIQKADTQAELRQKLKELIKND